METLDMMDIYRKVATPGAPHRMLAGMAGSWNTRGRCWMEPGKPPVESSGHSVQQMVLDGRFLQQEFSGDMLGSPFTGLGFCGYDNHTGKYISTWMDTMGTAIMVFEGTASADGRTITQTSSYDDPVQGPMKWRSVTHLVDANTLEFEMYATGASGKEEKMMEITYTRATAAEPVLKH
jgi:Protein of unknown function (DUF1579)